MKQTAVEWLLENSHIIPKNELNKRELIEQAKEIERQQIVMAFWNSKHSLCDENTDLLYLAEQYYNAKFKQL